MFAYRSLDEGIYPRSIGQFIAAGEILERRQTLNGVGAIIRITVEHQRNDGGARHAGNFGRKTNRRRLLTK